jgi:hypothetical protein
MSVMNWLINVIQTPQLPPTLRAFAGTNTGKAKERHREEYTTIQPQEVFSGVHYLTRVMVGCARALQEQI